MTMDVQLASIDHLEFLNLFLPIFSMQLVRVCMTILKICMLFVLSKTNLQILKIVIQILTNCVLNIAKKKKTHNFQLKGAGETYVEVWSERIFLKERDLIFLQN